MKFILEVAGQRFILSATQLEAVSDAIGSAELLENKYVGGSGGNNYVPIVSTAPNDVLKVAVMDDHAYEALKLATKLHTDKK